MTAHRKHLLIAIYLGILVIMGITYFQLQRHHRYELTHPQTVGDRPFIPVESQ